ncbi:MAG: flagellar motor switch protein FliM [Planctomycetota bacterium]|nr:flagellar motor switch protein FliM [Planctomycetota bacterium]MCZ6699213.1 flagellar motor switch protein FliM [Planctomycetota bacterium]
MADILDQSEVDALLNAVSEDSEGFQVSAVPREVAAHEKDVAAYDFKRPERVSKDQMRALHSIHEAFARNFGASLSTFLRTIVEARVATTEQLTYSEFIHSLPSPTCFSLLSAHPLNGNLCLEISPLIIYPIVDRLLGGANTDMFIPQRPLTSIEQRLANRIIKRALQNLAEAWAELVDIKFDVTDTESNPHLVQIVAPNEIVVVVGFEIKMGARAGTMSLCIPFNVIEPVIGKLATQSWLAYSRRDTDQDQMRRVAKRLTRAVVGVRAYLGETTITVGDLMALAVGDIIKVDKLVDDDLIVQVEGRNKFAGRVGQLRGNRAIQITRQSDASEPL